MSIANITNMKPLRQKQEDPLNLRSLPLVKPEADGWPEIQDALLLDRRKRNTRRLLGGSLAVAATAVLTLALVLDHPFGQNLTIPADTAALPPVDEPVSAPLKEPTAESLIALSQKLENRLRMYRSQMGDLPADALVYQVELQDLIVQVDGELSLSPDSVDLWGQRVNLMMDVVRLYENSLRRDYRRMASL
jgi:hypothetical protein